MISDEREEIIISEAVSINPKRELGKGVTAKYVSMADLHPNQKSVVNYSKRPFTSGSRFKNGDTLLARITPCLENGKTAYIDFLEEGEIGWGSTEFIVLTGKEGRTDREFVYYLARSSEFRRIATASMTGTSGRQRVQETVFDRTTISLPSIEHQKEIASVLRPLDSKIDSNRHMDTTLDLVADTIFKRWFIDFEFPNEEGQPYKSSGGEMVHNEEVGKEMPEDWTVRKLSDLAHNHDSKRIPLSSREREKMSGPFPYYGANGILDYVDDFLFDGVYLLMGEDGTVISDEGTPILQYAWGKFWVNNHAHVLQGKSVSTELLYLLLKNTNVTSVVTGAVQPKINQQNMNELKFPLPNQEMLLEFDGILGGLFAKLKANYEEIKTLSQIRDALLPRLMSGRIRVNNQV
jgi:type I restriction enzyme S subunit